MGSELSGFFVAHFRAEQTWIHAAPRAAIFLPSRAAFLVENRQGGVSYDLRDHQKRF